MSAPAGDELRADCARCAGLCCLALGLTRSADFALDKPAGTACPHLGADFRCAIHGGLSRRGYPGCAAYDCFGAGQRLTRSTPGALGWPGDPALSAALSAAFPVAQHLHELRWHLRHAAQLPAAAPLRPALAAASDRVAAETGLDPARLAALDLDAVREQVAPLLDAVAALVRAAAGHRGPDLRGADLLGARRVGADLRGADLRGACLVGADLRRAALGAASLLGADLRRADLRGADLAEVVFLTQAQLDSARGDGRTGLPAYLHRPPAWR